VQQTELADALTLRGGVVKRSPDGALLVTGLDCLAIGGIACAHDITLYELQASRASLEQAFFELTRDATDYHASELTGATQGA
jgi:ABC-2 type transport system ATP-binding protein